MIKIWTTKYYLALGDGDDAVEKVAGHIIILYIIYYILYNYIIKY